MSLTRRILFRKVALSDAHVLNELNAENTKESESNADRGYVSYTDNTSDDYPKLTKALRDGEHPYAIHRVRENEGGHTRWECSIGGKEAPLEGSAIDFISSKKP